MSAKNIHVISAASGLAASDTGCGLGPQVLQNSAQFNQLAAFEWHAPHTIEPTAAKLAAVATWNTAIASEVQAVVQAQELFLTLGGDHSCAIGTWSGAATAVQGSLGLLWIDAHLDSHTQKTSASGNIHGMPVATLLGQGYEQLTTILSAQPKILPENICIVGPHSFEQGEHDLLQRLGVKVFYMSDIDALGLAQVLDQALAIVTKNTSAFGLSLDIDAIDPEQAPAVGIREAGGIDGVDLCEQLRGLVQQSKFIGFEIAEYNPQQDIDNKTLQLITQLVTAILEENNP